MDLHDHIADLECQLQQIREMVGQPADAHGEGSKAVGLSQKLARLHQRLSALKLVEDPSACQRFTALLKLLTPGISAAVAESEHLERMEKESSTHVRAQEDSPG